MLFNFEFFSFPEVISEILPLQDDGSRPQLSWYNLTDGWYWLEVGNAQLFRYHPRYFPLLKNDLSRSASQRYVDYYVVELWEDMIEMLPAILEPLPALLARRVEAFETWIAWLAALQGWSEGDNETRIGMSDDDALEIREWWAARRLTTGYLTNGPNIWFWNDGKNIHIAWDNRQRVEEGIPVWEAQIGQFVLSVEAFMDELASFQQRFLAGMSQRVLAAQEYWSSAEYAQEHQWLRVEQEKRLHYPSERWAQLREVKERTAWERILAFLALIENDAAFQRIQRQGARFL